MQQKVMTPNDAPVVDITILGGGPTGLFAAFYAGLRGSSCKIIDSLPALGGRLMSVYPEKHIYDVGGFPKIRAQDLVNNLVQQIAPYQQTICLEENVLSLEQQPDGLWRLGTDKGFHLTKTVILCTGVGSYAPKKHNAPGAERLENKGVSYAILDLASFAGKRVVVVGGGDSALDWANELVPIAKHVTLVHRSDSFRAHEDSVKKLMGTTSDILLNTEVLEFCGEVALSAVNLKTDDEIRSLPVDAAVVFFGYHSSVGELQNWGLTLNGKGIVVNERMETNLPGVFAAGDVATHGAKLDLIATGFSEAAIAVAFSKVFLNPKEKAQPLHSTTIMDMKARQAARQKSALTVTSPNPPPSI